MKIYVASSWRNEEKQQAVVSVLREAGHEIYDFRNPPSGTGGFHWSDIDPNWRNWTPAEFREALNHPIANRGYADDKGAMDWAEACVMVQPCGASAHTEIAYMAGQGKLSIVLLDHAEPELMYKLFDYMCVSIDEVLDMLQVGKT